MRQSVRQVIVLLSALVGCGSSHHHTTSRPIIDWSHAASLTPAQRDTVMAAYAFHRASWERNHHRPAPTVTEIDYYSGLVPMNGVDYEGFAHWPDNILLLDVEADLSVAYTYHELEHLDIHDSNHTDPRWAVWNKEQDDSVAEWRRLHP